MATPTVVDLGSPGSSSLLHKSALGARYLILLQLFSRILTFAVNQILLRYLSPELLGISTQLETYAISVLFFSREALRVAIQRQTEVPLNDKAAAKDKSHGDVDEHKRAKAYKETQSLVNLAYISICLGAAFTFVLAALYMRSLQSRPTVLAVPFFKGALQLYAVAAIFELLAEPCFVVVQQRSEYKIRASAEAIATVLRCLITCSTTIAAAYKGQDVGVLPFGLGQVAYSLSILVVYCANVVGIVSKDGVRLLPSIISSKYVSNESGYIYLR